MLHGPGKASLTALAKLSGSLRGAATLVAQQAQIPGHAHKRKRIVTSAANMEKAGNRLHQQRLSVAPMMDWTDVHYRQLARLITKHTWLYTEMVVDNTVVHAEPKDKWLWFPPEQHPIVCQLGGSNPETLAKAAAIVEQYGYDEINLNCGCPSERVAGAGCFGASLMLQPETVAACCAAMRAVVSTPVTIKCRIGVDKVDSYEALCTFICTVAKEGGIRHFIIHARKCILKGLSPAQNRTRPPLKRSWVFALARDFPELNFSLNGVVDGCNEAAAINAHVEAGAQAYGVMIGRAAYNYPWQCLADADRAVFGAATNAAASRRQVLVDYARYGDSVLGKWGRKRDGTKKPDVKPLIKPLLGIFHGERGTKRWKQELDRILKDANNHPDLTVSQVLEEALQFVPAEVIDAPPQAMPVPLLELGEMPLRPESFTPLDLSSCATPQVHKRTAAGNDCPTDAALELDSTSTASQHPAAVLTVEIAQRSSESPTRSVWEKQQDATVELQADCRLLERSEEKTRQHASAVL